MRPILPPPRSETPGTADASAPFADPFFADSRAAGRGPSRLLADRYLDLRRDAAADFLRGISPGFTGAGEEGMTETAAGGGGS